MRPIKTLMTTVALLGVSTGFASAAQTIYIPLGEASQVQVIDTATQEIVDTIDDVGNAHGLAITPDKRYLIVGSFSESAPGDADIPKPAAVSETDHEAHHSASAKTPLNDIGTSFVTVIDASTREVVRRIAVQGAVHHVAVSPDGKYAVTTHPGTGSISVIDLKAFETVANVNTGPAPNYAVFAQDGKAVYVSNAGDNSISEIGVPDWTEVQHVKTGATPEHIVLSSDGLTLYTNNVDDGTASAISLIDGYVTQTYPVGGSPHGIDLSDDGQTLFATSKADNRLVAINLSDGSSRSISLSPAPYHLTAVQDNNTLYVSSRAENRIWILDQTTLDVVGEVTLNGIGHQMVVANR